MNTETRSSFLQQLSLWATKHIAAGRSPFRKTQIRPKIITHTGTQHPDLVFWINKDSFVSGGFILCVGSDDFDLGSAQACAQALGLSYFASWSAHNITIWNASSPKPHLELPAPCITKTTITDPFEDALIEIMDQFRTLAVLGTRPPQQLSYWHLTNLFLATTTKAQTALTRHLRSQPDLHNKYLPTAYSRAQEKIHLCIARILALTYFERIPHNLQPEHLDNVLKHLISELEAEQFTCLAVQANEANLDEKSAIALHHLLHRLGQVAVFHDQNRASKLLQQLLIHSAQYAGAAEHAPCPNSNIYLYCDNIAEPHVATATTIDIDTRARIAIKHLMRQLLHHKSTTTQIHTVFDLPSGTSPCTTSGFLYNSQRPDITHRNNWLKKIKIAWAGAIFELPRTTPIWAYEFIYLLGALAPQSALNLCVPTELFASSYSAVLVGALQDKFTLHTVNQSQKSMVHFTATKECDHTAQTQFTGKQQRTMAWSLLSSAEPEIFALALNLEESLLQLITQKVLKFAQDHTQLNQIGVELYMKSWLAQTFLHHLTPTPASNWQPRLPLPNAALLETLVIAVDTSASLSGALNIIDKVVYQQLNLNITVPTTHPRSWADSAPTKQNNKTATKDLREKLINMATLTGVPQFPEQYLFDYYKPQLASYENAPQPWQITTEFMGTFQLTASDSGGDSKTLNIDNEYLACAIVLASWGDLTITLPVDLAIVEKIVVRYLADLGELHRSLWSEAHAAIPRHETANRLVSKTWKALGLPPWKTVDEFRARFLIH